MRILVNASTLVEGGGIQVGVSFIQNIIKYREIEWVFIVSKKIYENLEKEIINNERVICCIISPSKLISGYDIRKMIKRIERENAPDLVYSIGYPSYIRFKTVEIGRYTNPWTISQSPLPWGVIKSKIKIIEIKIRNYYRLLWSKNAKYIETQTEIARDGIIKKLKYEKDRIKVIPNSVNKVFIKSSFEIEDKKDIYYKKRTIIFCLSAAYPHKNLIIVPEIARILKTEYSCNVEFILTIPKESKIWKQVNNAAKKYNVNDLINNVGRLKIEECIEYYKKAKIVFMPTLLEIFSATYLEAMIMGVPIITTDLEFAHDNCGDAAIYYDSNDPFDAAKKIFNLINDYALYRNQLIKGKEKIQQYPSIEKKYDILIKWLYQINEKEKNV